MDSKAILLKYCNESFSKACQIAQTGNKVATRDCLFECLQALVRLIDTSPKEKETLLEAKTREILAVTKQIRTEGFSDRVKAFLNISIVKYSEWQSVDKNILVDEESAGRLVVAKKKPVVMDDDAFDISKPILSPSDIAVQDVNISNSIPINLARIPDRPEFLKDFFGQEEAVAQLEVTLNAIRKNKGKLPHMLFTGGAGLGKTTLAKIVANEMGLPIRFEDGTNIRNNIKLMANIILEANKTPGTIIFIDEVHLLSDLVRTSLYQAMEYGEFAYTEKEGKKEVSKRIKLVPLTIIGGTTHSGKLSKAFRDRFERQYRLEEYTPERLASIVKAVLNKEGKSIEPVVAVDFARHCRGIPRWARRNTEQLSEVAANDTVVTQGTVAKWKKLFNIDDMGLFTAERKILKLLVDLSGEPASLDSLAAAISEEAVTVKDEYEPYLIKLGLIERTSSGRVARKRAYEHLGYPVPDRLKNNDDSVVESEEKLSELVDVSEELAVTHDVPVENNISAETEAEAEYEYKLRRGKGAELFVANALAENLDSAVYHIYNNLTLPRGDYTMQIDHAVVSPYGIFVIETKDYAGVVEGYQNAEYFFQQTDSGKRPFYNPIKQNAGHIKGLIEILGSHPYIGAVLFSDRCELKVQSTSFVGHIVDLIAYIESNTEQLISDENTAEIIKLINDKKIDDAEVDDEHKQNVQQLKKSKQSGGDKNG